MHIFLVVLICFVIYLKNKILWKMCILYCLVLLNSVLFLTLFVCDQQKSSFTSRTVVCVVCVVWLFLFLYTGSLI